MPGDEDVLGRVGGCARDLCEVELVAVAALGPAPAAEQGVEVPEQRGELFGVGGYVPWSWGCAVGEEVYPDCPLGVVGRS